MFRKLLITSLVLVICFGVNIPIAHASGPSVSCTGGFDGTVTHGSDRGLELTGTITLSVDARGDITGTFTHDNASVFNVTGKFHGRIIRLNFDLGDSQIRGVGQLPGGFTPCTTNFGGHFVGPKPGDIGDWGIIWGS